MRQGPDYRMRIRDRENELLSVYVPIECLNHFEKGDSVNWRENPDGTYTVTVLDIDGRAI